MRKKAAYQTLPQTPRRGGGGETMKKQFFLSVRIQYLVRLAFQRIIFACMVVSPEILFFIMFGIPIAYAMIMSRKGKTCRT